MATRQIKIGKIGSFFKFMDDKYYSDLENTPDDMEKLTKLLDRMDINP